MPERALIYRMSLSSNQNQSVSQEQILTDRQRECLTWVRQGKSSTDIGVILGISGRVVDEHIAHACERLGVRTRMQAVFAASLNGYLDS